MIRNLRIGSADPRQVMLVSSVEPNLVTVEAMRFLTLAEAEAKARRPRKVKAA